MKIHWIDDKIKEQMENLSFLENKYDKKLAENVVRRIKEIEYSDSYVDIPINANKHSIKDGKKFLYFAVDLPHKGSGRGKMEINI